MTKRPKRIYLIVDFKFMRRHGFEFLFKRVDLRTFHTDHDEAGRIAMSGFCDEAGWYDGVFIEEKEEGNIFFHGKRDFWVLDHETGKLKAIPEPEILRDILNLV